MGISLDYPVDSMIVFIGKWCNFSLDAAGAKGALIYIRPPGIVSAEQQVKLDALL